MDNNKKVGWVIAILVVIVLAWWFMASTPAPSAPAAPAGSASENADVASLESELNAIQEPSREDLNSLGADIEGGL